MTLLYRAEFVGVIMDEGAIVTERDRIQVYVDKMLLELTKLNAADPLVGANIETGAVTVKVDVEESEMFMASLAGFTQIRTAVHAAELGTPGWKVEWVKTSTVAPEVEAVPA